MERVTCWTLVAMLVAFMAYTAQPVDAPASCAGKVLCVFIME